MITLTRSEPAKNLHRFYALHLTHTLFGEWVPVAEWGRIGSPGTVRQQPFPTADLAQAALVKRLQVKARRGYCARQTETSTVQFVGLGGSTMGT